MNTLTYLRAELLRVFKSPGTLLVITLTMLCPLAGYYLYKPVDVSTTAGAVLANPALAGGLLGAFLFAALTLYELNRVRKSGMEALTDGVRSPLLVSSAKMLALSAVAFTAAVLTAALYLPYTLYRLGAAFFIDEYISAFGLFLLPGLVMGVLLAAAFYQIWYRVDLSFICFLALALFSMSKWCDDLYLMRWINPLVPRFSSDFGNTFIYRYTGYSRLVWLALAIGIWLLSLLCIRVYEKGIWRSFAINTRIWPVLTAAVFLLGSGVFLWRYQPYVDHAPLAIADGGVTSGGISSFSIENDKNAVLDLSVLSNQVFLQLDVKKGTMSGRAVWQLENKNGQSQECVMNMNTGHKVEQILANGQVIPLTSQGPDGAFNMKDITFSLPADQQITLEVIYSGMPQVASSARLHMTSGNEITPRFVSLRGNALSPKISVPTDCPVEGEVTLAGNLEVISSGTPAEVIRENTDGTRTWSLSSSNGRLFFYAGDYVRLKIEGAGFPVYFCYSRTHEAQMEALDIKKILTDTIAYCSKRYGTLPYTEQEPLQIVMDSAHSLGGGASGNISYMTEAVFTKESMSDPLRGANAAEVIAHEIVHQWWGMKRFVMDAEYQPWSAEALTSYTTYRIMKELHGEEYAQKYYIDIWNSTVQDINRNFYLRNQQYQELLPQKYLYNLQMEVLDRNLYSKAPLQVLQAERLIGGEGNMDHVLSKLFQNGGTEMPPMVTWQDFLDACHLSEEQLDLNDDLTGAAIEQNPGNSGTVSTYIYDGQEASEEQTEGNNAEMPKETAAQSDTPAPFIYDGNTVKQPEETATQSGTPAPFIYDGNTVKQPEETAAQSGTPAPFIYDGNTVKQPEETAAQSDTPKTITYDGITFNQSENKEEK